LRAAQAARVPGVRHAELLAEGPGGPMILLANEFFDALPIRQFVRGPRGWAERVVGLGPDGLRWGLGPAPSGLPDAPVGAVIERCAAGEAIAADIGARLARDGGGALIVDYGAAAPETGGGDTLQALRAHAPADPLAEPGAADLTAHVDFARLAAALAGAGAAVAPLSTQGALLGALGIGARAAALAARNPAQAAAVEGQLRRLCDPAEMGTLFKALAATGPGQPPPPGFGPAP
jgi:NADH dehydrogenase [ubiquinone] 1 alpha subcomplex assembly factor 7